jgi:hypothetical protein
MNKRAAQVPLHVNMPNGTTIQSYHTREFLLSALSLEARRAHILPGLVHSSLISVGQLCDSGCDVNFTQDKVEVNKNGKSVMSGVRDENRNYGELLYKKPQNQITKMHVTIHVKLHATAFSPVKSTWIKAIKNGNLSSGPGLTEYAVEKHLSKSAATVKGHLNQQRMSTRSTQPQKEPECTMTSESNLDDGIKTQCIYAAVVDAGQIYTDQTGIFTVISSRGNVSIMVLYEYDGNSIMAEPIKNNKIAELLQSFHVMEQKLTSRGLRPKLMTLDNEAS